MASARRANSSSRRRVAFPGSLGIRAWTEVEGDGVVIVTLIEDGATAHLVHILPLGFVDGGPAAQGRGCGGGARRNTAQQCERGPVTYPSPSLRPVGIGRVLAREGEDVVEELAVGGTEPVLGFLVLALGKRRVGIEIVADIGAAALDEVAGEPAPNAFPFDTIEVLRQIGEIFPEQVQERAERRFVAAVRSRGHQQDVPVRIGGHTTQQLMTLLATPAHAARERAAVRLVHDHELGALEGEVFGAPGGLDEVGGHHRMAISVEDRDTEGQIALQPLDGARQHKLGLDVELLRKLPLPLLRQVRRAEHRRGGGSRRGRATRER